MRTPKFQFLRYGIAITLLCILNGPFFFVPANAIIRKGDVNGDRNANKADCILISNHILGISPITNADKLLAADYDGNGIIDVADILAILADDAVYPKRIAIIGDSNSTFGGQDSEWNLGHDPEYVATCSSSLTAKREIYDHQHPTHYTNKKNIDDVSKTWWYQVAQQLKIETDPQHVVNCSWSGCGATDLKPLRYGKEKVYWCSLDDDWAFMACSNRRIQDLGYYGDPDIIVISIGINDFIDDNDGIGNYLYLEADKAIYSDTYKGTLPRPSEANSATYGIKDFCNGYTLMLYKIKEQYPKTKVYCCTVFYEDQYYKKGSKTYVNDFGWTMNDLNKKIKYITGKMGYEIIDMSTLNLTNYRMGAGCIKPDGSTTYDVHYNADGHELYANQVAAAIIQSLAK